MWQPERAAHGPFAVTEADIPALNRLFAEAFTDRYRRDGLVGVRVPFLNPAVWRYALLDAGEGAMLWRDESDRVVAFNIAHRSGTEGWMGPLAVRPDRQMAGLGRTIVLAAADWLKREGATTIGLETMPRTVENIGFYSRLGFLPGHLTVTMTVDTAPLRRRAELERLSELKGTEREERLREITGLVDGMAPGYDFAREIELTLELGLGDVLTVRRDDRLAAFVLCHDAPLADGGGRDEVRALKIAAADDEVLLEVLQAAAAWAHRAAARRLAVRCQTAYPVAYRALVSRGFRVRWTDLRMTMEGFPECVPRRGVVWSNWEI
jgi:GNAT superfamily N-acetyltransferase